MQAKELLRVTLGRLMGARLLKPSAFKLALLVGVVFAGVHVARVATGWHLRFLDLLEEKAIDVKFQVRGSLPLSHQVAIAAIDEKSIRAYGLWPWSRAVFSRAIEHLDEAGVGAIALDMAFTDPDRNNAYGTFAALKEKLPNDPQLAEVRGVIERAMAEAPDAAMARAVEKSADKLVLGVISTPVEDVANVPDAIRRDWERQLAKSAIAGTVALGSGGRYKPEPPAVSRSLPVLGTNADVIEGWVPELGAGGKNFGLLNIVPDDDGTLRHYAPVVRLKDAFFPSLAVQAVATAFHSPVLPTRFGDLGLEQVAVFTDGKEPTGIPVDPFHKAEALINYVSSEDAWLGVDDHDAKGEPVCHGHGCDRLSLSDVVDGHFDPEVVKGKVVFVGATALGTFDQRVTPFDSFCPGVFVHMNVAEDLLSRRTIEHPGQTTLLEAAMLLLIGLLFGLLVPRLSLSNQLGVFPVSAAVFLIGNQVAFKYGEQLITVTPLMELAVLTFGVVFFQYMTTDREKRQVRSTFQHYLTESVMEEMLQDPSKLKLGGQKRELTVFFSDIRGFTTLSEMLPPDEVSKLLNEYLTPMTDLVFENLGTLDKYMGDAIMAFWGAPAEQPDHALRACKTAVTMLEKLDQLRAQWRAHGRPDIDIGIGLNSGHISVGNMGSNRLFNYTVIGDDVNLASRLEGTNKTYGTRIILGENTFAAVKGKVVARELGGVMVKGKKKPVTIYELRGMGTPSAADAEVIATFERGLAAYRARNWDEAVLCFKAVLDRWPHDGPSEKYLDDIDDKRANPPPAGWDGVYVMKTK